MSRTVAACTNARQSAWMMASWKEAFAPQADKAAPSYSGETLTGRTSDPSARSSNIAS